ncbi:MAG TPA: hypothetical protein DCQ83_04395 [Fibrobacteres bacterium]|jgi:rubrerythrin|nr:hypothetical protein [Fibrobacterota bacterium]
MATTIYEAAFVLLRYQKKSLVDLVGGDEAKAADTMLKAVADEAAKIVQKQISAYSEVWKSKKEEERQQLMKSANRHARPYKGHIVKCPACANNALVTGEEITQQQPSLENEELVVRTSVLPMDFECAACGLTIHGHAQLHAAGLGGQFTNKITFDPVEFYAVDDDAEHDGSEYNNE